MCLASPLVVSPVIITCPRVAKLYSEPLAAVRKEKEEKKKTPTTGSWSTSASGGPSLPRSEELPVTCLGRAPTYEHILSTTWADLFSGSQKTLKTDQHWPGGQLHPHRVVNASRPKPRTCEHQPNKLTVRTYGST